MQATYTRTNRTNRSSHASNRSADRAENLRMAYVARRTPPVTHAPLLRWPHWVALAIVVVGIFAPAFVGGL